MMSYAAAPQRNGFLLAVVHIVNRDWGELTKVYQKLGFIPPGTDVKPIELALEDALPDVLSADISELNFKNVVGELGDIMYTYPFSLPPFYISIIRCLGVLEGLAIQVDPKSRIISEAYPYVANRVLTDDTQEELREALRRLIFTAGKSALALVLPIFDSLCKPLILTYILSPLSFIIINCETLIFQMDI